MRTQMHSGPESGGGVTIRDIAIAAGVSVATVSRVLGGTYPVAKNTRTQVLNAIDELGYIPNAHAQALAKPCNSVVLVVPRILGGTYVDLMAGVNDAAEERGMTFQLLTAGGDWLHLDDAFRKALAQRAKVVIFAAAGVDVDLFDKALNRNMPQFEAIGATVVVVARPRHNLSANVRVVDYANKEGMEGNVSRLIDMGHRNLIYVGAANDAGVRGNRYRGFLSACDKAGLEHDLSGDVDGLGASDRDMTMFLPAYLVRPETTAIVCATDIMALGVIRELKKRHVCIPQDVAVTGFDDIPLADSLIVPLTTVHAPFLEMGRMAVSVGLDKNTTEITLPTKLVIRESA